MPVFDFLLLCLLGQQYDSFQLLLFNSSFMRIFLFFLLTLPLLMSMIIAPLSANCSLWGNLEGSLEGCIDDSGLLRGPDDILIETGLKEQIITWTNNLAMIIWLLAVGAIVLWGLFMVLAGGEDEKIKKWKDIVFWSVIWFLWLVSASAVIRIVIEVIFSFA